MVGAAAAVPKALHPKLLPPSRAAGHVAVYSLSNRKNHTAAFQGMVYGSFPALEPLNVVLGLEGFRGLVGRLRAREATRRSHAARRPVPDPRGSLQPGPLLLPLVLPPGITGPSTCPPGGALVGRMSPVWLWLSLGPGDLEKMQHELLKARVPGLETPCPGKPSTHLISQMPTASPPPTKSAPTSSAPLGMHGDNGVSTPMAETLSQRSTQNTCSSYLRPNQPDGDTVNAAGFKATSWPHTPTGQYHAYPAPKHTKQLSCTPRPPGL